MPSALDTYIYRYLNVVPLDGAKRPCLRQLTVQGTVSVALDSMLHTHDAVSEDTYRRSCKSVSGAEGAHERGYDLLFILMYAFGKQIIKTPTSRCSYCIPFGLIEIWWQERSCYAVLNT